MNTTKKAEEIMLDTMRSMKEQGFKTSMIFGIAAFDEIAAEINTDNGKKKYWGDVMDEYHRLEREGFYEKYTSS